MDPASEAGPVSMRLKTEAQPNIITVGALLASMVEMRELSLLKPHAPIAVRVFLAFDDLQSVMNAAIKAFNAADDKKPILDTEVELPFQPFPIEQFSGGDLSPSAFMKLKGWLLTRGPSAVRLPTFGEAEAQQKAVAP